MHINRQKIAFVGILLYLLCYFMLFMDFPNELTVCIGGVICIILMYKQKKFRFNVGTCLLSITMISYYVIRYGFFNAIFMGLPYVGILMYVLADYLACEVKTKENSEKLLFSVFFVMVLGYAIHGFLNSYMYLTGFRTAAGRHWYDFWLNVFLPATEQVIYFLPVLSLILPAIIFFRENKPLNIFVLISSVYFLYISWISDSRTPIFIFPLVLMAQLSIYLLVEWDKVKRVVQKNKILFVGICVSIIFALILFITVENPLMTTLETKLGRSGGVFGSIRFVAQRRALQQLFDYPMGGSLMELGIPYAHNVWLDMANRAGLIPFFAFVTYTFWTVYEMVVWLTQKEVSTRRKLMVAGAYGAFFLYYTIERGIDNGVHFMTPWFFINGMVHGELSMREEKINRYKKGFYERFIKRPQDFLCALIGIIILSPVMLITAILVRTKLGSPVIFKQERPGLNGKVFTLYKFRTMTDAKDADGNLLPSTDRLTRFGKKLRSTSLDELPELFNILKGDMSVVGPRPLLVRYLPLYNEHQARRHEVRPGFTGLAQINGRNAISWEEKFDWDVKYVDNITFLGDWKIIFKTVSTVLKREGISSNTSAVMEAFQGTPLEK